MDPFLARSHMETYYGQIKSPNDAIILFEACRHGSLPRVQRRLSEKERQQIRSGSVFVWDEREAGMRRWTDGKSWSASRVAGSFLTYREMEGKRGAGGSFSSPSMAKADSQEQDEADASMALDGYRYKPDGLVKQSFSITTSAGQHLHLICYFARSHPASMNLPSPSSDQALRHIRPTKGMYPELSVHDIQSMPAVTRSPMAGSPYGNPNDYQNGDSHLRHPPPQFGWPPTPATPGNMAAPWPGGFFPYPSQMQQQNAGAIPWLNPAWVAQQMQIFSQQHQRHLPPSQQPTAGPTAFDRAPPPMKSNGAPPPPPAPAQPYPQHRPQAQTAAPNHTPYISPVNIDEQTSPYNATHPIQQQQQEQQEPYQPWAERQTKEQPQYPIQTTYSSNGINSSHHQNRHTPHAATYQAPQQGLSPQNSRPHHSTDASSHHARPSLSSQDQAPSKHQSIPSINALIDQKNGPGSQSPTHYQYSSHTAPPSMMPTIYSRPPEIQPRAPDNQDLSGPQPGYGTDMNALRRLDRAFAP